MKVVRPAASAAILAFLLAVLVPVAGIATASAQGPSASASAKRAANVCAKRAPRSTASWRRCIASFRRSSSRHSRGKAAKPSAVPAPKPSPTPGGTAATTVNVADTPEPAPASEPSSTPAPQPSPAPAPSGSLVIGIDGGHGSWTSTETTYRAQLDAAVTRHEWDPTEPVDHQDALVLKAAAQAHTRIHALLGGNELGSATAYREFVTAFIRRYGVGGSFWDLHPELDESRYAITTVELGNEPYFEISAASYADTVRPTLEAIRGLNLPVKVILPQRVYGTDTSWMDTLYQRIPNLNGLFYAFAEHPYWYAHDPAQVHAAGPFGRIGVMRKRMNEKGAADKPIYLTEYGESTASCGGECVGEPVQAEHLHSMLNAAITRTEWRVEMVSVFQLIDRGTNSGDRELQFGLLRQDGSPKPAYGIVRGLMQQYRG